MVFIRVFGRKGFGVGGVVMGERGYSGRGYYYWGYFLSRGSFFEGEEGIVKYL